MKSILQDYKVCYWSKMPDQPDSINKKLDKHHIFFGSNRKVSEQNGFWVWLQHEKHIADSIYNTPHNSKVVDNILKRACQKKYEETHSREEFIQLIGRNYLDLED